MVNGLWQILNHSKNLSGYLWSIWFCEKSASLYARGPPLGCLSWTATGCAKNWGASGSALRVHHLGDFKPSMCSLKLQSLPEKYDMKNWEWLHQSNVPSIRRRIAQIHWLFIAFPINRVISYRHTPFSDIPVWGLLCNNYFAEKGKWHHKVLRRSFCFNFGFFPTPPRLY